jgi:glutathione S-transferase
VGGHRARQPSPGPGLLGRGAERDPVEEARAHLDAAFGVFESRLQDRSWLAGEKFTVADCAAVPALFYIRAVHPWGDRPELERYFRAALDRPSVARVIDDARPYRAIFPPGFPADFDA